MLEVVCDWRSLYARHTVTKLCLIAPLRQASHSPVFDPLSTSLKYFAQSMHVLSVATQVNLPFSVRDSCWAVAFEQHGVRTLAPHT